jgi:hypothetical protein
MQFDNVKNLRPKSKDQIKVTGSLTGEEWAGEFEFWTILTHRQQMDRDRLRRDFLGARELEAPNRTQSQAEAIADLQVRIFKAPKWWMLSNGGQDLVDDEVLTAVYDMVIKAENDFLLERAKKVAAAKGELQNLGQTQDNDLPPIPQRG